MGYTPLAPTVQVAPLEIAPDTWQIHHVQEALGQPLFVYLNSLVIKGSEPVIVDTGSVSNQRQWREDVFGLVDPADVKWVFLSHDDHDHTGNLAYVMEMCPNATLVCSWAIMERLTNAFAFPLERCRWINDGESFSAGDRELLAVRPPLWDSPTTRGLLDRSTGVYWGVDAFACPMPGAPVDSATAFDAGFWGEGMAMFMYNALSPWLEIVDAERYGAMCDRVQSLGMSMIATAHSPLIPEASIDDAFALMRALPSVAAPPAPNQAILEAILSGTAAPAHA